MTGRNIFIGTVVFGSLFGVGYLINYFLKEEKEEKSEQKPKQKEKAAKPKPPLKTKKAAPKQKVIQMRPPMPAPMPLTETPVKTVLKPLVKKQVKKIQPIPEPLDLKKPLPKAPVEEPPVADEFPLRMGSKGPRVERLNVFLTRNFGWRGLITDEFDEATHRQLKRHMRKDKLDQRTYKVMRMAKPVHKQRIIS